MRYSIAGERERRGRDNLEERKKRCKRKLDREGGLESVRLYYREGAGDSGLRERA